MIRKIPENNTSNNNYISAVDCGNTSNHGNHRNIQTKQMFNS